MGKFYDEPYDDSTLLKLKIFREYLGVWISIFMNLGVRNICIYDFFSGPGYDAKGQPGTPVIIVEEVRKACSKFGRNLDANNIRMIFNDKDKKHYLKLQENISLIACSKKCCTVEYLNKPFKEALELKLPEIKSKNTSNFATRI
jgi:three-Cys-motif partner protein